MIKISNQSQYGLRAMVYLAQKKKIASAKEIALAEAIPSHFLEKILVKLKKAGLIMVKRGAGGGYFLSQSFRKVSVADIIRPLEGKMALTLCLERGFYCPREKECLTKDVWFRIQKALIKSLESINLSDLIK